MTLLPNIHSSILSMFVYIPLIAINIILVVKNKELRIIQKEEYTTSLKKYIIALSFIIIIMSFLSDLTIDLVTVNNSLDMKQLYLNSRMYYSLGLLIAGIICDKNKEMFDVLSLCTFIFCLISIVLVNQNIGINTILSLCYFFLGFFVIFRTSTFMNISDNKHNLLYLSAYGLMYSRIIESILGFIEKDLLDNYLVLVSFNACLVGVLIWLFFFFYAKGKISTEDDKLKAIVYKYKLSIQEEKVLNLLVQDYTNREIADKLYISVNTIRNHVANIYKKTGMNKKELREKIYLGAE